MRFWLTVAVAFMASAAYPQDHRDDLANDLRQCWNVGSLSAGALRTTVTIEFFVVQNGRPDFTSIHLVSGFGGSDAAIKQAFEAARRAIIRCGATGFHSSDSFSGYVRVRFHAENMRVEVLTAENDPIDI